MKTFNEDEDENRYRGGETEWKRIISQQNVGKDKF